MIGIDTKNCFLRSRCKKYKKCKDCDNDSFCIKLYKINELYNLALLSDFQKGRTILKLDTSMRDKDAFSRLKIIEDSIENFVQSGKNIYLHSAISGNGKTSWAVRLIQDYINAIWYKSDIVCKALFINVPRFLLALKDNISNKNDYITHIHANILDADIVVWDDIATKGVTEYESENLLSLIDTRINLHKSNIFTSNMNESEIYNLMGTRLASRIINLSENIEFFEFDKRGIQF